jgi:hypothetical protein
MSLPLDLLEQADHLSRRETKKPRQASLRRSTSTAYFALFHLLSEEAAATLAPHTSQQARYQLQRCLNHNDIKLACNRFLQTPLAHPIAGLLSATVSNELRSVALAFVQLQDARHGGDYDLNSQWTRSKAIGYVQMTRDAFTAWGQIRRDPEANLFLLSFVMLKQLELLR